MTKCNNCDTITYSVDIDNDECDCGVTVCYECDAEYSKDGELLSYGKVY